MQKESEQYKQAGLYYCDRILSELRRNQDDADNFFGGEPYKAYINANEKVIDKIQSIRRKIRNL